MIMTVFIFVAGMLLGMFGAAMSIVGFRRKLLEFFLTGIFLMILGSLLVPNAHAIALAIHGGAP